MKLSHAEGALSFSEQPYRESLIHQVVVSFYATGRQGSKCNKSRGDIGSGSKPWRQKGTGRARAGTKSSPIWRSGGVTFAAKPRDYTKKVNKRMYRAAMRSILAEHMRRGTLHIINPIVMDKPNTKLLASMLEPYLTDECLVITPEIEDILELSARNIPRCDVVMACELNPALLVAKRQLIVYATSLEQIEERYSDR